MWYQYTRTNAQGRHEVLYTKDINLALIHDPLPVPCPSYMVRGKGHPVADWAYVGMLVLVVCYFFGALVIEFIRINGRNISISACTALIVTLLVLRCIKVMRSSK